MRLSLTMLLLFGAVVAVAEPWGLAVGGAGARTNQLDKTVAGAATLTDADLPTETEEIVFLPSARDVRVSTIALTNRTVRFSAPTNAAGVAAVLKTSGETSAFQLAEGDWTFDGVAVVGSGVPEKPLYRGGAIECVGGSLAVTNCSFNNLCAVFAGGAVCARLMTGPVAVTSSEFVGNQCRTALSSFGGAFYCSGVLGGATVDCSVVDCSFVDNAAYSGGAISTHCAITDDETPVALSVSNCVFSVNSADFSGGAVAADGSSSFCKAVFSDNFAGLQGGALNLGSSDDDAVECQILADSLFSRNVVSNDTYWTCGGAVAVWGDESHLDVDGRYVVFAENYALSGKCSFGGAVFASSGTVAHVTRANFRSNVAGSGSSGGSGGAVYLWNSYAFVDTSIFSNNTVSASTETKGVGGAISADTSTLVVTNVTIRFSNEGAVAVHSSTGSLYNVVVADNSANPDIVVTGSGSSVSIDHSAYGVVATNASVSVEAISTNACVPGVGEEIYEGETLHLVYADDNPAASDGIKQDGKDYDDWSYNEWGDHWSIGAYVSPVPPGPEDDPYITAVSSSWYHNRGDGLYYPSVTLRYVGGDLSRLTNVVLRCDGVDHSLPESCVATLRTATENGQQFTFGVETNSHWIASTNSSENFGYIIGWTSEEEKAELMLFAVTNCARVSVADVAATNKIKSIASSKEKTVASSEPTTVAFSALNLSLAISVPVCFEDFSVASSSPSPSPSFSASASSSACPSAFISGRALVPVNASVRLLGCAELGDEWSDLGEVCPAADGSFVAEVSSDFKFFKLSSEVTR